MKKYCLTLIVQLFEENIIINIIRSQKKKIHYKTTSTSVQYEFKM